jgi:hypothetical protein
VYEVEAVFGRDATSVFPNMNKDDDPMEALKASIGAKRFVSETEVGCKLPCLCSSCLAPCFLQS